MSSASIGLARNSSTRTSRRPSRPAPSSASAVAVACAKRVGEGAVDHGLAAERRAARPTGRGRSRPRRAARRPPRRCRRPLRSRRRRAARGRRAARASRGSGSRPGRRGRVSARPARQLLEAASVGVGGFSSSTCDPAQAAAARARAAWVWIGVHTIVTSGPDRRRAGRPAAPRPGTSPASARVGPVERPRVADPGEAIGAARRGPAGRCSQGASGRARARPPTRREPNSRPWAPLYGSTETLWKALLDRRLREEARSVSV